MYKIITRYFFLGIAIIFDTLQKVTGVSLEDSRLSNLYDLLVVKGNHEEAEEFVSNAVNCKFIF